MPEELPQDAVILKLKDAYLPMVNLMHPTQHYAMLLALLEFMPPAAIIKAIDRQPDETRLPILKGIFDADSRR